jgi:predicted HTH domain antitoxin
MEEFKRVRKTDLARNTRQVIREVQRGQTAIVESHGQPEVAILDIIDYRILRAVMRYYTQHPEIDVEAGLADEQLADLVTTQARYDLVLAHYLAGAISLGRAAELLDLPWLDLRTRCLRLDIPLRTAPADLEEARADVEAVVTGDQ